jgi:hypothetical protein
MSDIGVDDIICLGLDQLINKVSRLDIVEEVGFGHDYLVTDVKESR